MKPTTPAESSRTLLFKPSGFETEVPGSVVARARRDGSGMMDDGELLCLAGVVELLGFGAVANAAHIGGLMCGAVLGALFGAMARSGGDSHSRRQV